MEPDEKELLEQDIKARMEYADAMRNQTILTGALDPVQVRVHIKPVFTAKGQLTEGISIEITTGAKTIDEGMKVLNERLAEMVTIAKGKMTELGQMGVGGVPWQEGEKK